MVKVSRSFRISAPKKSVWDFISDPNNRVRFLPSVKGYRSLGDGEFEWDIHIPVVGGTISFRTHDIERIEGKRVEFKGEHRIVSLRGVNELREEGDDDEVEVKVVFEVDSRIPGVESAFKRIFNRELRHLQKGMVSELS
ncbi:MAG: SRPBCC family protein [Halobacteria archaeon]|nr:SRPBCC family protein [Halobacteria archaeon]